MTITVQCLLELTVEYPGKHDGDDDIRAMVEDTWCPGTGVLGWAIEDAIEEANKKNVCWACTLKGQNRLISINRQGGV